VKIPESCDEKWVQKLRKALLPAEEWGPEREGIFFLSKNLFHSKTKAGIKVLSKTLSVQSRREG
jgi:hypothetical protein